MTPAGPSKASRDLESIKSSFLTVRVLHYASGEPATAAAIADGTDVNRNIASAATTPSFTRARHKYETFLGIPGFCSQPDVVALAQRADHDDLRRKFADTYKDQLHTLGYVHTDIRQVRHYYYLLFASRHSKGLEFWKESCKYSPANQKEMTF